MKKAKLYLLTIGMILTSVSASALSKEGRDQLISKLEIVESMSNPNAVGDRGKAIGILQIHAVMVQDFNRISGKNYTHRDMFDPVMAREVADVVLGHYDRHIKRTTGREANEKQLAFIWNGGASAWKRVYSPVNDQKQTNLEIYWTKVQNVR